MKKYSPSEDESFALTRRRDAEDKILRKVHNMEKIRTKAVLTKLPVGERTLYRLVATDPHRVTEGEFLQLLAAEMGQSESQGRYWLDSFRNLLFRLLSENADVDLGFLMAKLYVGGSIESIGEQPTKERNPVRGRVIFKGDFANRLKAMEVMNDTVTVEALLYELQQDGVADQNRIESKTARVVVNGSNIKIDAAREDEGIWLENISTGVKVADATVSYSDSSTCYFTVPALPPTGKYRLVVATRNGENPDDYALAKVTRNVYIVKEA